MNIKKYISLIVTLITIGSLALAIPTFAQTNQQRMRDGKFGGGRINPRQASAIVGKVSLINGTTLEITIKAGPNRGTATIYTVDASKATVTKNGQASSVSNITLGDTITVQGTVSGTNVTAKTIRDDTSQPQQKIQDNGQSVIEGSVTSINGNTIIITNKSNIVYTIDASNAKFVVTGITSPSIANITVEDNVVVQGTVNGTNVTASSVIDQKTTVKNNTNNPGNNQKFQLGFNAGFIGGIVDFFKHLFGF